MPHLLIFDDDAMTRDVLAAAALEREFTVVQAGSVKDALLQLDMRPPDLMLADISRFGEDGLAVCRDVIDAGGQLITLCSQGSIDTAVQALRIGAKDYLVKPLEGRQVATLLDEFSGGGVADGGAHCGRILGESAVMQEVYTQLRRAAPTDVSVLLIGESGTGKELAAEAIHQLSQRSKEKFVAVNCGAISPNLIESELFGHERGSFTGADRQHKGYFEQADGGTLFLDELTEMPIA
ncbi:MAG TPA: sigma 54-interacting transcriptional regulator, partial [Castellaniella sp.]|nr:sigma 54-interacting transcriptional regulator [Castellaniella sp.]